MELTACARYVVHARELVSLAHQPALLAWKVSRGYQSAPTLVGTPATHDIDHGDAGLVDFAVQGAHLVGHVE